MNYKSCIIIYWKQIPITKTAKTFLLLNSKKLSKHGIVDYAQDSVAWREGFYLSKPII